MLLFLFSVIAAPARFVGESARNVQKYIVTFKERVDTDFVVQKIRKDIKNTDKAESGTKLSRIDKRYKIGEFKGIAGRFTPEVVDKIRQNAAVAIIEPDFLVTLDSIQKNAPEHLSGLTSKMTDFEYPDTAGENVTIYIVDTGVDINNPEFEGRASNGYICKKCRDDPYDTHGTQVASLAASRTFGVAKKAKIVSVKAFDDEVARVSSILSALNWIINEVRDKNISNIVNFSFSCPYSRTLDLAVDLALKMGVNIVTSAGNLAQDSCDNAMSRVEGVIVVGSVNNEGKRAQFSNLGKCISVYAPGVNLFSVTSSKVDYMSGTSASVPLVVGALALHLQVYPSSRPYMILPSISKPFTSQESRPKMDLLLNLDAFNIYYERMKWIQHLKTIPIQE